MSEQALKSINSGDKRDLPLGDSLDWLIECLQKYRDNEDPEKFSQFSYACDVIFFLGKSLGFDNSAQGMRDFLEYIEEHIIEHHRPVEVNTVKKESSDD